LFTRVERPRFLLTGTNYWHSSAARALTAKGIGTVFGLRFSRNQRFSQSLERTFSNGLHCADTHSTENYLMDCL
jgi:hypothetical protein